MRSAKYRCPKCGNTALVLTKCAIIQRTYKLRLDGEPYARQFDTTEYEDGESEGIECTNCGNTVTLADGAALKKWCNHEYKPAKKKR